MTLVKEIIQTYHIWQILIFISALTTFIFGMIISILIAEHNKLGNESLIVFGKLFGLHLILLFFYNYYKEIEGLNRMVWFFRLSILTTFLFLYIWAL